MPSSQVKYLKLLYMIFLCLLIRCEIINLYLPYGSLFLGSLAFQESKV